MAGARRQAFTLIELLVVIAILSILAAILFPVFAQARAKARQAGCLSNFRQIGAAVMLYVNDYDERLPTTCSSGRAYVRGLNLTRFNGPCAQESVTEATPISVALGAEQTPPRYIQEFLHPY